jgi:hypothetical protein
MDSQAARTLEIFGYYLAAFVLIDVIVGALVVSGIVRFVQWLGPVARRPPEYRRVALVVGMVERVMYTASILLGRPEFVAVWLAIKSVGEWRSEPGELPVIGPSTEADVGVPKEYVVFLIGAASSVLVGVVTGLLVQQLVPPLPSLKGWQLPLSLTSVVPLW